MILTLARESVKYASRLRVPREHQATFFNNISSQANCVGTYRIQAEKSIFGCDKYFK